MADVDSKSVGLGAARKCSTRDCKEPPVEPREALPEDQLEFSTGRVATVEWACKCRQTRQMVKVAACSVTAPDIEGSTTTTG